jgi:Replicative DNA helicase
MDSRIPSTPKSLEAEQAFLGSLIMDSSSWDQVSHMVESKDFIDTKNREIFNQIYNLASSGQVIDVIVLGDALKTSGLLDKVGGLIYLEN